MKKIATIIFVLFITLNVKAQDVLIGATFEDIVSRKGENYEILKDEFNTTEIAYVDYLPAYRYSFLKTKKSFICVEQKIIDDIKNLGDCIKFLNRNADRKGAELEWENKRHKIYFTITVKSEYFILVVQPFRVDTHAIRRESGIVDIDEIKINGGATNRENLIQFILIY